MPAPIGLLNLDKPTGPTSHDVVQRVRRAAGIRRVGHAGTLDPLATGILLVFLGRATRFIEYVVGQPKTYVATIRLGQETDTYDAEGEVVAEQRPLRLGREDLDEALVAFRGDIDQLPPMFSAVKRDGQPLYKLARQGVTVEREPRQVTIYELTLLDAPLPDITLRVRCSAGTYIRTLAHDLGQRLGCGGHIIALRRTAIGGFHVEEALRVDALDETSLANSLLPIDRALSHLASVTLSVEEALDLRHGRLIGRPADIVAGSLARAYGPGGQFLGVVKAEKGGWQPRKMLVTGPDAT